MVIEEKSNFFLPTHKIHLHRASTPRLDLQKGVHGCYTSNQPWKLRLKRVEIDA